MNTWRNADDGPMAWMRPNGYYLRPDWTAELRRIEAQILSGVTWS